MKNSFVLLLCFTFIFSVTSCSDQDKEQKECEYNLTYPNLPKSTFLDGFYDILTAEFTIKQLESCECEDLLAVQAFKNEYIEDFLPFPMSDPMTFSCSKLQEDCNQTVELKEEEIINLLFDPFNIAYESDLILKNEYNLMESFFNQLVFNETIDYDHYWCQLELMEKPKHLSDDVAGLLSAYTITYFQGPDEYFSNYSTKEIGNNIEVRWINVVLSVARKVFVKVVRDKYIESMKVLTIGALDGKDTSTEALCTALD